MGVLANHVPSIEQLKPGLVEIIDESGANKQFFRMSDPTRTICAWLALRRRKQFVLGREANRSR